MPATESAMGTPGMGPDSSSGGPGGKMMSGWASPSILGLLVFGLMTMLLGLYSLPKPYGTGFGLDLGGLTIAAYAVAGLLLIIGVITLAQNHLYWGTAFLGYAAFWGSWGYMFHHLLAPGTLASGYGVAGIMFIWLLFTLTYLISSIRHGWGTVFAFLLLFVGFILLTLLYWQLGAHSTIATSEHWVIGGELILTGLVWWYGGTAGLTNHTFGKKVLPT